MNKLEFLDSGVDKKKSLRALKYLEEYLGIDLDNSWRKVIREDIHSLQGKDCFRSFLDKKVKNSKSKNEVLKSLEDYFDFMIIQSVAEGEDILDNPVIRDWDKFKVKQKYGTYREVIDRDVLLEMRNVLSENNFQWCKDDFLEDWNKDEFCYSTSLILWIMTILPLRFIQAQYLDSGLKDEFIYDYSLRKMIKNLDGIKGRQEGFIRKSYYNGFQEGECLYVNTNKSSQGFEIPWISEEVLREIGQQVDRLKSNKFVRKEYGTIRGKEIRLLFPDKNGVVVSKSKVLRLWKKLCIEVERRMGVEMVVDGKLKYGLHSLRVSGVSSMMTQGISNENVGKYFSGQTSDIVLYYYSGLDLEKVVCGKVLLSGGIKLLTNKKRDI